jgi:maleylpyruvate isomerase
MGRTLSDSQRWMRDGFAMFVRVAKRFDDAMLDKPSLLPDWTRRHVVSHVAANADALGNLVEWAATGVPTPMYASPEERLAGIQRGAGLSNAVLISWLEASGERLLASTTELSDPQWETEIITAQGRHVPATEIPWMRSREVWVHAVDLDGGTDFGDLPDDFLLALRDDVEAKRGGLPDLASSEPVPAVLAYLTGRPSNSTVRLKDGKPAPPLPPWL